ncbi:hypothetical protein QUW46_05545 [Limosilactobacillus panis]|uniref:Uncharacterized protein n=1 Tax=Limosilactobacillus panis TaxID=47493 RepID=A0ABT7VMS3_9LACO|nr:hypothetical protein [Limosilactobacillus panis]
MTSVWPDYMNGLSGDPTTAKEKPLIVVGTLLATGGTVWVSGNRPANVFPTASKR